MEKKKNNSLLFFFLLLLFFFIIYIIYKIIIIIPAFFFSLLLVLWCVVFFPNRNDSGDNPATAYQPDHPLNTYISEERIKSKRKATKPTCHAPHNAKRDKRKTRMHQSVHQPHSFCLHKPGARTSNALHQVLG